MITYQVLAMGIAHRVRDCPRNETEWQKASNRLNCTSGHSNPVNKYHCLPADNRTTLLELCYNRARTQVVEGIHAVISTKTYDSNYSDFFHNVLKKGTNSNQLRQFKTCIKKILELKV